MTISRRSALLGLFGAIVANPGNAAVTEIAASPAGPIALTPGPAHVALRPADGVNVAAKFAASTDRHFILTLEGLATDVPPDGGFLVFLNVPENSALTTEDAGFAGPLSFFGVPPPGAAARAVSFDVTEVLQRLRAAGRLGGAVTVTIRATAKPAAESHPTINRIALVEE
jgi:hypothetical protein